MKERNETDGYAPAFTHYMGGDGFTGPDARALEPDAPLGRELSIVDNIAKNNEDAMMSMDA